MSGESEVVTNTTHSTNGVGTRTQMSNFSQILVGVLLLGKRVLAWVAGSNNLCEMAAVGS